MLEKIQSEKYRLEDRAWLWVDAMVKDLGAFDWNFESEQTSDIGKTGSDVVVGGIVLVADLPKKNNYIQTFYKHHAEPSG